MLQFILRIHEAQGKEKMSSNQEAPTTEKDVEAAWMNLTESFNKYKVLLGQVHAQQLQARLAQQLDGNQR